MIMDMFGHDVYNSETLLISKTIGENGYIDILLPEFNPFATPDKYTFESDLDGYFNIIVNEGFGEKVTYLPAIAIDFIQSCLTSFGYYDLNTSVAEIGRLHHYLYDILFLFWLCSNYRMKLAWFIYVNPYQQPFDTLRTMVDWYLNLLQGWLPALMGIDYSPTIMFAGLGWVLDYTRCLAVVPPFKYSEGEVHVCRELLSLVQDPKVLEKMQRVKISGNATCRVFTGLPSVWVEKPIPDKLREYWTLEEPNILDYLIKHYSDLGVNFYPDELLKMKSISQVIGSSDHSENLSAMLISLKTSILSLPLDVTHLHF